MKLVKATKELLLELGVGDYIIYAFPGQKGNLLDNSNIYLILKITKSVDDSAIFVCDVKLKLNNVIYRNVPITKILGNMYVSFGLKKRINKILSL